MGGAEGVQKEGWERIQQAIEIIAQTAQDLNAAILDGGTHSGVMAAIGKIRTSNKFNFPLIGIAALGTVKWPGRKLGIWERITLNRNANHLDENHTHFLLVPGKNWGDESIWISDTATQLSGNEPSIAILINGGKISRDIDVPNNLKAGRIVLVIQCSGRAADELANHPKNTSRIHVVPISNLDRLTNDLKHFLHPVI